MILSHIGHGRAVGHIQARFVVRFNGHIAFLRGIVLAGQYLPVSIKGFLVLEIAAQSHILVRIVLIVGGVVLALLGVGKILSPEAMKWAVIAVGGISALAIYIFNTPGRNPLVNIGAGLWDTYNMATGILGDVLSYLRLFALGLAGGMLGQAFNNLAISVKGDSPVTWLPFVLILVIGHVMNIMLSGLGAFVHPMRLTFMEYFKNAGYEGKGAAYNPLTTNKE